MSRLYQWAIKWGIPQAALEDYKRLCGMIDDYFTVTEGASETAVQSSVRLEASKAGHRLFRNNVGVLRNDKGVPVRFGLCNDTKAMNEKFKSSDLIGFSKTGKFIAREVKESGWIYTGTPREQAQLNFIELVNLHGGDACFVTGTGSFEKL